MRILTRLLAALGGLMVLAIAGVAVFALFRLASYEPLLDERHSEAKRRYLDEIEATASPKNRPESQAQWIFLCFRNLRVQ